MNNLLTDFLSQGSGPLKKDLKLSESREKSNSKNLAKKTEVR